MGACGSKSQLETVDDSVHVMIKHDKKVARAKGQQTTGYIPRAEHPLLKPKGSGHIVATEEEESQDLKDSGANPTETQ